MPSLATALHNPALSTQLGYSIVVGQVSTAPSGFGDQIYVVQPTAPIYPIGPMDFGACQGNTLPAVGDACVVVLDDNGTPYCVWFDGTYSSYEPSAIPCAGLWLAGQALAAGATGWVGTGSSAAGPMLLGGCQYVNDPTMSWSIKVPTAGLYACTLNTLAFYTGAGADTYVEAYGAVNGTADTTAGRYGYGAVSLSPDIVFGNLAFTQYVSLAANAVFGVYLDTGGDAVTLGQSGGFGCLSVVWVSPE